ncbi:tRNA glutamyl-Q(34) synthetase GluQRS [soil metagenome]
MTPALRFAPTPSGALHTGHAYSALLNERMARDAGGRLLVRIEDTDTVRCPRHLSEAVLADLAWLGLVWEEPVLFQSEHLAAYHATQSRLDAMELLYPCFCSRQEIAGAARGGPQDPEGKPIYPGTCRALSASERRFRIEAGVPHAWRLDMPRALAAIGRPLTFHDIERVEARPEVWGDVILVRKDTGTSYHISGVVDDARQGVTDIVRGKDLFLQTSIHRVLQTLLDLPEPRYHHHDLICDPSGRKLSKSAGDRSLRSLRDSGVTAAEIRMTLGF